MLTDLNEICMTATPGHDKTPKWIFLLELRRSSSEGDSTIKVLFMAVIIDHFHMKK